MCRTSPTTFLLLHNPCFLPILCSLTNSKAFDVACIEVYTIRVWLSKPYLAPNQRYIFRSEGSNRQIRNKLLFSVLQLDTGRHSSFWKPCKIIMQHANKCSFTMYVSYPKYYNNGINEVNETVVHPNEIVYVDIWVSCEKPKWRQLRRSQLHWQIDYSVLKSSVQMKLKTTTLLKRWPRRKQSDTTT